MSKEAAFTSFFNDQEAETDLLGFEPYVYALTDFLVDPLTKPPLTISIEGEWGAGKSSFLRLLKKNLKERSFEKKKEYYKVEFNPWRYSQDEALWASFAIEFEKQLTKSWSAKIQLVWNSIEKKKLAVYLVPISIPILGLLITFGLEMLGIAPYIDILRHVFSAGIVLMGLYPAWELVRQIHGKLTKNIINFDIKKYQRERPSYQGKIPFLSKFHSDLEFLAESLVKDSRIYIFIDDLDRCQPGQAAELMQAINLMMGEKIKAIFIMAIDRKKIAAGIATDNEKYLKALCPDQEPIVFGFEYIDKFIQLPFLLPHPKNANIDELVRALIKSPTPQSEQKKMVYGSELQSQEASLRAAISSAQPTQELKSIEPKSIRRHFEEEIESISEIISELSPVLQHNPRKIKKFLNIWRVQTHLANRQGLFGFNPPNPNEPSEPVTMYQFGKYLGLAYIWPNFVLDWWKYESKKFLTDIILAGNQYYHADGITQEYWAAFGSKHKLSPSEREEYIACLKKWIATPGLFNYILKNAYALGESLDFIPLTKILTISPVYKESDLSDGPKELGGDIQTREEGTESDLTKGQNAAQNKPFAFDTEEQGFDEGHWLPEQVKSEESSTLKQEEQSPSRYDKILDEIQDFLNNNRAYGQSEYVLDGAVAAMAYNLHRNGKSLLEIKTEIDSYKRIDYPDSPREAFSQIVREIREEYPLISSVPFADQVEEVSLIRLEGGDSPQDVKQEIINYLNTQSESEKSSSLGVKGDWQSWTEDRQKEVADISKDSLSKTDTENRPTLGHTNDGIGFIQPNVEAQEISSKEEYQRIEPDEGIEYSDGGYSGENYSAPDEFPASTTGIKDPISGNIRPRNKQATNLQKQDPNYRVIKNHPSFAIEKIPGRPQFRKLIHIPTGRSVTISRNDRYEEDADLLFRKYRPDFDGE